MTQLQEAMDQFARRMGVPSFEADADASFAITFDEQLTVNCSPEGPTGVLLSATVGSLPADIPSRSEMLRELLRRNLALARTLDEIISVDGDTDQVILHSRVALPQGQLHRLESMLESFTNRLAVWRAAMQHPRSAAPISFPLR